MPPEAAAVRPVRVCAGRPGAAGLTPSREHRRGRGDPGDGGGVGTPLSRLRPLPPSYLVKGDNASARYKPEHGVHWHGLLRGHRVRHYWPRALWIASGPSEAMARLLPTPLWPCREARGVGRAWAAQQDHASCSDSLRLFERSAAGAKRVPQRRPATEHRRLPAAKRRDTASGVAFLLPTFLLAKQKKVGAPPGAYPGLRRVHEIRRREIKQALCRASTGLS